MAHERPIFVLGAPRSGTTLLQVMLSCHPRLAVPPETRMVVQSYRARAAFGDLREAQNRAHLARWLTKRRSTKFRDLGLSGHEVRSAIKSGPPTLGSALEIIFKAYAARFDSPRWGDKWPSYYRHVPALLRLFPDAQFVHLVRDGRDCVASQVEMPWFKGSFETAASIWAEAVDNAGLNRRRLRADQWHELRYEDLVTSSEATLRSLCTFLGEDFDPAMTKPDRLASKAVPARKTWHSRVSGPLDAAHVGRASTALSDEQRAVLEFAFSGRLRAYGYEVQPERPPAAAAARLAAVAARRRVALRRNQLQDKWRDLRERAPVATMLGD